MSIPIDVEERVLKRLGLNPLEHTLSDEGDILPRVQQEPTSSVNTAVDSAVPTEESSVLGTTARSFGRAAIPTLGAWAAGAKAATVSVPLAARLARIPVVGPAAGMLTPLVAGAAAGIGTAMVADTAQDFVLDKVTPEFKGKLDAQMAIDRQQRPVASAVGQVAANLPAARPTMETLRGLSSLGRKLPDYILNGAKMSANEAGALVNTGVGVGLPVGLAASRGEEILSPQVAGEIAANMFFAPRKFVGGTGPQEATVSGRTLPYKPSGKNLEITRMKQTPSSDEAGFVGPPDVVNDPVMQLQKQRETELVQADQAVHEATVESKLAEASAIKTETAAKFQAERQVDEDGNVATTAPLKTSTLPRGPVTAETINRVTKSPKEAPFATPIPAEPLHKTKIDSAIPPFMKKLASERDVDLETSPVELLDDKGNRVRGVSGTDPTTGKRIARVNSTTPDTYPHEIAHPFLQDVKEAQPKLYARIERQLKGTQAYRDFVEAKTKKGQDYSLEEFMAEGVGKKTIDNLSNSKNEGPLKDALSAFKARMGNGNEIINMLSRRLRYDAPSKEWRVPQGKVVNPSTPKSQPDESDSDKGAVHAFDWDIMGDGSKVLKMYNATKDIVDPQTGEVMHPKDSTISKETLDKYNVKYQPEEQQELPLDKKPSEFDKMRSVVDATPEAAVTPAPPKPSRQQAANERADKDMDKARRLMYQTEDDDFSGTSPNTKDETKQGFFEAFVSQFDKVAKHSKEVSESLKNWASRKDSYLGTWRNSLLKNLKPHSIEDVNTVIAYRRDKFRLGKTDIELIPEQELINEHISAVMDDVRNEQRRLNMKIDGRNAGKNPDYIADMFNDEIIDAFRRRPDSMEVREAKKLWLDYLVENDVNKEDARNMIRDYVNAIGAQKRGTTDFGALRKPMGFGLPEQLREKDGIKLLRKYAERSANDMAFFREVESNPDMSAKLLDRTSNDYLGGVPDIQNAMKFVYGDFHYSDPKIAAASRLVTNLMLGLKTGITDTISIPALASTYFKRPSDFKTLFTALGNLSEARESSLKTNARSGRLDMLAWHNVESPEKSVTALNKLSELARKFQGRDLIEQGNRVYVFAIGRELAKENYSRLLEGDKGAAEFMEKFGRLTNVEALAKGEVEGAALQEAFDQIAKNFVDRNQGTYAGSGLPSNVMEGPIAPFVTLAKWNLEKSNVVWQDVVKPLQRGDVKPFLAYTAGTMLTATAIQQIAELLTGKKQQNASFSEAKAMDSKEHMVASVINLAQQGSLAGIMSDIAKMGSDIFIQEQRPQSIAKFPLWDAATSIGEEIGMLAQAAKDGDIDAAEAAMTFVKRLALGNVQNYRLAMAQLSDKQKDKIERSNKFRDVRVFKKLSGEHVPDTRDLQVNEYENPEARKFKQTDDLNEAASLAPQLLEKAVTSANDPIELKKEFEKLKRNSYQTMPDPQNDPLKFGRFYQWLVETEGQREADERVQDYFEQKAKNKIKSSMVP